MATTTISRTAYAALADDSGSGTDGTVWAKSNVGDILDAIDAILAAGITTGAAFRTGYVLDPTTYTQTNANLLTGNNADALGVAGSTTFANLNMYLQGVAARRATISASLGGTLGGNLVFYLKPDSASDVAEAGRFYQDGGMTLGTPTGASKGAGTLNATNGMYKNGTAFTNPDFVFEHWVTGAVEKFESNMKTLGIDYDGLWPLDRVEAYTREHFQLPLMSLLPDGDIFDRGELLYASLEQSFVYLFDHERRIAALEARVGTR